MISSTTSLLVLLLLVGVFETTSAASPSVFAVRTVASTNVGRIIATPRGGSSEDEEYDDDEPAVAVPVAKASAPSTSSEFAVQCESVKSDILDGILKEIEDMKKIVLDNKECIPAFGLRCEELSNKALEEFASKAPAHAGDDIAAAVIYDKKLEELETSVDSPLEVLYMRQLAYLREKALSKYRSAVRTSPSSDYEAMLNADAQFERDAEELTREGSSWDFSSERSHLQTVMNELASSGKKLSDIQLKNAQQQSTAMQFLQQQQQMIQQLQMQLYGQTSPWNVGVAYRIPDTNFNIQGAYQQGRTNIQVSCIPDEYASLLGPNGFTSGVGPGNLGLSLNLSI